MVVSLLKLVVLLSGLAAVSLSKPVASSPRSLSRRGQSFDNFGGSSSLNDFDNFYGNDNFDGSNNQQVIIKEKSVQCREVDVRFVQQKLAVLREQIKRTIIEQVCQVETQTIVLEQFSSGIDNFGRDVRRQSNRQVSYDGKVANFVGQLQDSNGNLNQNDLGFDGNSVGSNSVSYSGDNWNSGTSPGSVGSIWQAGQVARGNAQAQNSPSPVRTVDASLSTVASTSSASPAASSTS